MASATHHFMHPADQGSDPHDRDTPHAPLIDEQLIDEHWNWHDDASALLRAAIESANDAVMITDATFESPGPRIEYVNPAFTEMTGYSRDDVIGKTPRILQGPKTDHALLHRLREDLENERPFHGETVSYRKDGTEYVVEWRITPLRNAGGKVQKWVAIQRDVTDRVKIDHQRDLELESERLAREDAERIGRLKDEFLSTLSHELRTPLNAILGWAQLLNSGRLSEEERKKAAETVERNARMQSQLIDDLLDMSRILNGGVRLDMIPLQVAGVVEAAFQSVAPTAAARSVKLELLPSRAASLVVGDPVRLKQVVWNLISNAVKFTPAGGSVRVVLEPAGADLAIRVSDTGAGIEPGFLPHVFERFRQADASTTRRHGGLGLGLSIVKQLVELHGGTVEVYSAGLGKGSTFSVRLPVSQHTAGSIPPPTVPVTQAAALDTMVDDAGLPERADVGGMVVCDLHGIEVMIVDDEADARAYLRNLLEQVGASVVEAASAPAAIEMLSKRPPAVILSDIGMPETDGYDLMRQIRTRTNDAERNVPAIALTAFARAEDRRRALLAGYQSHLAKPVDAVDLIVEIASLCGRAKAGA
jgi:PAS domain S-box-containing protein